MLYAKEAKQQEEKIERLKAEAEDEYVIKKQVRRINYLKHHPVEKPDEAHSFKGS